MPTSEYDAVMRLKANLAKRDELLRRAAERELTGGTLFEMNEEVMR
jgi:hypothetical protein